MHGACLPIINSKHRAKVVQMRLRSCANIMPARGALWCSMSSAHLPSQVPVASDYERGIQKGIELALRIVDSSVPDVNQVYYIRAALQELAK